MALRYDFAMTNSGRNIVFLLVGVAALVGARQGEKAPPPTPAPAPPPAAAPAPAPPPASAATSSALAWAEVLVQNPDPAVITDADLLKRITETHLPWMVRDKSTGIEMVLVPPGKFVMGMSPGDEQATEVESPAHEVTISKAFYLGRTEVTQKQWERVMDGSPSKRPGKSLPVEQVSFENVRLFLKKARSGLQLPTEAQWEYACRAGTTGSTYGDLDFIAWHQSAAGRETHSVAQLQPNALGLYDMLGNVAEWCQDWFSADYYKSCTGGVVDPTGSAEGSQRLLRGGDWYGSPSNCRASCRAAVTPSHADSRMGFRVARTP